MMLPLGFIVVLVYTGFILVQEKTLRNRLLWLSPAIVLITLGALLLFLASTTYNGGLPGMLTSFALVSLFGAPIAVCFLLTSFLLAWRLGKWLSAKFEKRFSMGMPNLPGDQSIWLVIIFVISLFLMRVIWVMVICVSSGGYPVEMLKFIPVRSWTGCFKYINIF